MFSVLINSRDDNKYQQVKSAYEQVLAGENWELIRIPDAKSMAEGYNRGFRSAHGEIVILSHDDAAPLRPCVGSKIRSHVQKFDIIGGAGADKLVGPQWFTAGLNHVFGQVLNIAPPQVDIGLGFQFQGDKCIIAGVRPGSVPSKHFLHPGMTVTHIYDKAITSPADLSAAIQEAISKGGKNLRLTTNGQKDHLYLQYPDGFKPVQIYNLSVFGVPGRVVGGIHVLDGFWLACKRGVLEKHPFDEVMCDSFHMYDVDWSYRAWQKGFKLGVACDLNLGHASTGGYNDPKWKIAADKWLIEYGPKLEVHKPYSYVLTSAFYESMPQALVAMDEIVAHTERCK